MLKVVGVNDEGIADLPRLVEERERGEAEMKLLLSTNLSHLYAGEDGELEPRRPRGRVPSTAGGKT
ncbi:hypothetical protein EYF80_063045 [Liparis tanakae]|uniref:Uncharacterized protein n=1 Tax=Liparis tanakae TaxID=230148 RepID=A0A4Z2EDK1_9TELE|nr:hypothetical protein EYF80_063045 [Liparis tanakae]